MATEQADVQTPEPDTEQAEPVVLPTPSGTPPALSVDELFAATWELHERYMATEVAILESGVVPVDAFVDSSTAEHARTAAAEAQKKVDQGTRARGQAVVSDLLSIDQNNGVAVIAVCIDKSGLEIEVDGQPQESESLVDREIWYELTEEPRIADVVEDAEYLRDACET